MADSYAITVDSSCPVPLVVYTTLSPPASDPPSTDPADYVPTYTALGTVDANGSATFPVSAPLVRVVVARRADAFPIRVAGLGFLDGPAQSLAVGPDDIATAEAGWAFFKAFASQPFSPTALAFSQLVETTDVTHIADAAAAFFDANGAPGLTFGLFSALGTWAGNDLHACPGTYYCYEPPEGSALGFVLPTTVVGLLTIADGTASYAPAGGGPPVALSLAAGTLASAGATANVGLRLTAILRDLAWEGQPDVIAWAFVGTSDGQQFIAQSYETPQLPWYAVTYDLVYGAFFTVQLAMALDAAIHLLGQSAQGLQWLARNVGRFAERIRSTLNDTGEAAGPGSGVGDEADPVNVDIDIDVDIDVDVDVDIDIDVDVDVDIDVDVDVDFMAVVDVDVDVDIDIDIDVVTDTDTDVDVDIDIDTDVDVPPGTIARVLGGIGNWIMTKALPTLIEGAVVYLAFSSAGKLLEAWRSADEAGMANLQPRQTTGLGLLVNYMLNDKVAVADRWTTFSQYVAESAADPPTVAVTVSAIVQTANATADAELAAWRWSASDEAAAVAAMAGHTGADSFRAFQTLAGYTFAGKPLPVKVAAGVALKYLKGAAA